jgi:hypothetical protein
MTLRDNIHSKKVRSEERHLPLSTLTVAPGFQGANTLPRVGCLMQSGSISNNKINSSSRTSSMLLLWRMIPNGEEHCWLNAAKLESSTLLSNEHWMRTD